MDPITDRDWITLFNYFIGARGNHAVHVRALIHAGFDVAPDPDSPRKSYVVIPDSGVTVGVIVGEPEAVIGRYSPPEPPKVPTKIAGRVSKSAGY